MMEGMAEMIAAPNELLSRGRMKPCTGVVDAKSAMLYQTNSAEAL